MINQKIIQEEGGPRKNKQQSRDLGHRLAEDKKALY